jgi:hypothetical protein
MGSKIEFITFVQGLESIEECRPKPAKNFIPQWFKDIPSNEPKTVKFCPSFPDYFSMGYVLPMWTDVKLQFNSEKQEWVWNTPSDQFLVEEHGNSQFIDYVKPSHQGVDGQFVFKMVCPWRIVTPPGWSVLQLPLFYNFNKEFSVLPGVIDTDIHHYINQQVLYHGNGKEIEIIRGTPLALYIPFKRENSDINLEVRSATENDIKKENTLLLNFKTMFRPGIYRKMQRDRDNND